MVRLLDIIFSGLTILVLSPFLVAILIVLRFTGEGEIFFKQERIGKGGKKFQLYKFATMLKNSPNIGSGEITMRDDPRVLPLGKLLRKTKINELPQLFNILIGDMSVIGPRPLTPQTFDAYSETTQSLITQVLPGLSGVGSIVFRGEEEIMHGKKASVEFYANVIAPYKGSLEEWFVANQSLYVYFTAIFITAWAVLFPGSQIAWSVFDDLPVPPSELKQALNYPN